MTRLVAASVVGLVLATVSAGCGSRTTTATDPASPAPATASADAAKPADRAEADEVAVSCQYIDRCLKRLEAEPEDELTGDRAAAIVSAAERTLPVFWGADPAALTSDQKAKIDGYPTAIRQWADKIAETRSRKLLADVRAVDQELQDWLSKNLNNSSVKWQACIDKAQDTAGRVQQLMSGMSPGGSQGEAARILVEVQKKQVHYQRRQLTAYQKWAIRACHQFAAFVLSNTINPITGDNVLAAEFEKAQVTYIDPGLLGADARRLYDIAVGFMDTKLRERNRAKFLLDVAGAKKWPLSDF